MSTTPRILAFAGSARRDSLNRKLLAVAVAETRAAGGEVTLLDLNDYALPLYHGDEEEAHGLPANATKLIGLVTAHQGLLIASPEYNSLITPLLKNTIDWITRADENPLAGKVAAVVAASPGALGGARSLQHARHLLLHLGCHIVPAQCILPKAHEAFREDGSLAGERTRQSVATLARQLVDMARKLG